MSNSIEYSGFLQAHMEPEEFREQGADYMAQVDFSCSKTGKTYTFFNWPICGDDARGVAWQRLGFEGIAATAYLGIGKCRNRQVVGVIAGINQYMFCDHFTDLHQYYPIQSKKKKELLQLPWMQQCLGGQEPTNIVP